MFQVVILAHECIPSSFNFDSINKNTISLLQVANRPILSYQLEMLEKHGFEGKIKILENTKNGKSFKIIIFCYTFSSQKKKANWKFFQFFLKKKKKINAIPSIF